MYKRLLIATDGSDLSREAIRNGIAIAKATGAEAVGFHAIAPKRTVYYGDSVIVSPDIDTAFEEQALATAQKFLGEIAAAAAQAGVAFKPVHRASPSPADAILQVAGEEKCDLIVMASHGRKGLSRVLLGSETNKVVTHANVPVLVTH